MSTKVTGVVRGLSRIYANGLEGLELHIRKRHAAGVAYVDGQGIRTRLHLAGVNYEATLRAVPKLDVLWFSPTLYTGDGKRLTMAEAFHRAGILRNERLDIVVDRADFFVSKRGTDAEALKSTIDEVNEYWRVSENTTTQILADLYEARGELAKEKPTTRTQLIQARLGQGQFRDDLLDYWEQKCAVTACGVAEVLVASHIKPWSESSNAERLDPFNGLLLAGTFDRLFDKGLVSFGDDGILLVAKEISADQRVTLWLDQPRRLRRISPKQEKYLEWHRKNIFRRASARRA